MLITLMLQCMPSHSMQLLCFNHFHVLCSRVVNYCNSIPVTVVACLPTVRAEVTMCALDCSNATMCV